MDAKNKIPTNCPENGIECPRCKCGVSLIFESGTSLPAFQWDGATWAVDQLHSAAEFAFVTHAHFDHLPVSPNRDAAAPPPTFATRLTRAIFAARGSQVPAGNDWDLEKIGAPGAAGIEFTGILSGHMEGAASIVTASVESGASMFYAGEFFPVSRPHLPALVPQPTTTLVIESTYGHPNWNHPPTGSAERDLHEIVEGLSATGPAVVAGDIGGKMPRIVDVLADLNLPFIVPPEFAREWQVLQEWYGISESADSPVEETNTGGDNPTAGEDPSGSSPVIYTRSQLRGAKGKAIRDQAIYLVPPSALKTGRGGVQDFPDAPAVLCSGQVLDPAYRTEYPASAYVPLRDHPTYTELLAFIKECHPEDVWVLPGEDHALCWAVRHELGIECNPLALPRADGMPRLPQLFFA